MDNQIINCRCGRERRNKESNLSGLIMINVCDFIVAVDLFIQKLK